MYLLWRFLIGFSCDCQGLILKKSGEKRLISFGRFKKFEWESSKVEVLLDLAVREEEDADSSLFFKEAYVFECPRGKLAVLCSSFRLDPMDQHRSVAAVPNVRLAVEDEIGHESSHATVWHFECERYVWSEPYTECSEEFRELHLPLCAVVISTEDVFLRFLFCTDVHTFEVHAVPVCAVLELSHRLLDFSRA